MFSRKIETKRLILRRYKESDIDAIYDIITDKRISAYIKYPDKNKKKEDVKKMEKRIHKPTLYL